MTRPYDAEPTGAGAGLDTEPRASEPGRETNYYDLVLGTGDDVSDSAGEDAYESGSSGLNLLDLHGLQEFGSPLLETAGEEKSDFSPDNVLAKGPEDKDETQGPKLEGQRINKVQTADTLSKGIFFKQSDVWLKVGELKLDTVVPEPPAKKEEGESKDDIVDDSPEKSESSLPGKLDGEKPETETEVDAEIDSELDSEVKVKTEEAGPETEVKAEPKEFASADGKGQWKRSDDGTWSLTDGTGEDITSGVIELSGENKGDAQSAENADRKVQEVEPQSDKSVKLTLDDGTVLRTRPDGSVLKYADENAFAGNQPSDLYKPTGDHNSYTWENGELKQANLKSPFFKVGENLWSQDPNSRTGWHGKVVLDGSTGDLRVTALSGQDKDVTNLYRSNGRHETHRPDGTVEFTFKAEGDATERTFKFKGGFEDGVDSLEQPLEMKVKNEDGKVFTWRHQSGNTYKLDGAPKQATIEVSQNDRGELTYKFENLDTGYRREVSNGRDLITDTTGDVTQTKLNDTLLESSIGGTRMIYDESGEPVSMEQAGENRLWTRDAYGAWQDQPLDSSKAYEAPDQFSKEVAVNEHLEDRQKQRMLDSIVAMESEGHSDQELQKFLQETRRIMADDPDAVMSPEQRADLAEQMLWHGVNEKSNDQGFNPSCSVTHLRGMLLHNRPSVVAGLMADIAHTGSFETADGSTITPPLDSLQVRKDSPEATFPPVDSTRSWLSQVWDVTAYNVHYQRQGKDRFSGNQLNGESISYELRDAKSGDNGCRLVKTGANGERFVLAKNYTDNSLEVDTGIGLFMSQALDVYNQISGETLEGRAFAHSTRYVGENDIYEALGGEKWSSLGDLESGLADVEKEGRWPIYVDLQTSIVKQRKDQQKAINEGKDPNTIAMPTGGQHLMMIAGYDPVSKTVEVDNSWGQIGDFATRQQLIEAGIDPATRVTFSTADLYNSMQRKSNTTSSKTFKQWYWMRDK